MKKSYLFLTGVLISGMLVACGNNTGSTEKTEKNESQTETQTDRNEAVSTRMEYSNDVTHDGTDDTIRVTIDSDGSAYSEISISVWNGDKAIFEDELALHAALGAQYYLVSYENESYLMYYSSLVDHDMATSYYEIFSLDVEGEKEILDSMNMEFELFDIENFDKEAWIQYADKVNGYFKDAFLLVSTQNAELNYSEESNKKTYTEEFRWLLTGDTSQYNTVEEVLDAFIAETKEEYQ